MKKLKLIYNPGSGDRSFKNSIDDCVDIFQQAGFDVHIRRSRFAGDVQAHIASLTNADGYDTIVVCGGDGTINMAVNGMMESTLSAKLGIIPSGTANDYASFLKLPKDHASAARVIAEGKTLLTDIGKVNEKYFINVCGAGFFTNISQHINEGFKSTLGKMAYYIKGLEQIQNFMPMNVRITNSTESLEESIYFLIVLNGQGAGGFENLVPLAEVDDGLFDFIAVRSMNMLDMPRLLFKVMRGEHLDEDNIVHFRDSYIKIEPIGELPDRSFLETDIDGELGPDMPVIIKNIPKALSVYHNIN